MLTPDRALRRRARPIASHFLARGRLLSILRCALLPGLMGCSGGWITCLDACEQQNQLCGASPVNCDWACSTVQALSEEGCQSAFTPLLECLQRTSECASLWNSVCGSESDAVQSCLSAVCSSNGQSRACRVGLPGRATTGGSPGGSAPSVPPGGASGGTCDPAQGCVATCSLGAQRCLNGALEICASGGSGPAWQMSAPCEHGCLAAGTGCRPCQLGAVQCLGNTIAECAEEGFRMIQTCPRGCSVNDQGVAACL